MKKVISLWVLVAFSTIFAEIHPGLKAAIDRGDIKTAKNLVQKVGVGGLYLPATLKVSDAKKIYTELFQNHPLFFKKDYRKAKKAEYSNEIIYRDLFLTGEKRQIDSAFVNAYVAESCKGKTENDTTVCSDWMWRSSFSDWKQFEDSFCKIKEQQTLCLKFLDSLKTEDLMPYFLQLEKKKILEYQETVEVDTVVSVKMNQKDCLKKVDEIYKVAKSQISYRYEQGSGGCWDYFFGYCCLNSYSQYQTCKDNLESVKRTLVAECKSGSVTKDVPKRIKRKQKVRPYIYQLEEYSSYLWQLPWYKIDAEWIKQVKFLEKYGVKNTENTVVENLRNVFARSGKLSALEVVQACALYPKIDKTLKKKLDMELFNCKKIQQQYSPDCSGKTTGELQKFPTHIDGNDSLVYICDAGRWRQATYQEALGECSGLRQGEFSIATDSQYKGLSMVCDAGNWREASKVELKGGLCTAASYGSKVIVDASYICDGKIWHEASKAEEKYGICDSTKNKQKVEVEEKYFYCLNGVWRSIGYSAFHEDCWNPELVNANDTSFQDCRDAKTYKTVKIGNQVWMAENLNYESENSFCYEDSVDYCAKYGRLYTWESAMQACPPGYHLPSEHEWQVLIDAVGGYYVAGKKLKSKSGNGTDEYGFSVLPAGYRHDGYGFYYDRADETAHFWSYTGHSGSTAYTWYFDYDYEGVRSGYSSKSRGYSVRCLRDSD